MNGRVSVIDGGTSYTSLVHSRSSYTGLLSIFYIFFVFKAFQTNWRSTFVCSMSPSILLKKQWISSEVAQLRVPHPAT